MAFQQLHLLRHYIQPFFCFFSRIGKSINPYWLCRYVPSPSSIQLWKQNEGTVLHNLNLLTHWKPKSWFLKCSSLKVSCEVLIVNTGQIIKGLESQTSPRQHSSSSMYCSATMAHTTCFCSCEKEVKRCHLLQRNVVNITYI